MAVGLVAGSMRNISPKAPKEGTVNWGEPKAKQWEITSIYLWDGR